MVGTMRNRWLLAIPIVLIAAACGGDDGGSDEDGVLSLEGEGGGEVTSTTRLAADEAVLEVTRCMRDNGIDVPDIGVTPDGQLDLQPEDLTGVDVESEEFQEAFTSCIAVFQLSGGFDVSLDPELEALFQDQLQEFSQCMRDNGITDFPDPQTGSGTPYPLSAFARFNDPEFQTAIDTCRETISFSGFAD
jgi:hypothetical protein